VTSPADPELRPRPGRPVSERRYTIMLVPEGARGPLRQRTFTLRDVRRLVGGLAVLGCLALVGVVLIGGSVQRSIAYGHLLDENLALKARLSEIEGKLDAVDRELQRLRLYDTQLRDVPDMALPGFGPLDADEMAAAAALGEGVIVEAGRMELLGESGDPMDDLPSLPDSALDDRLARVEIRTERSLQALRLTEITLGHAVESAEYWRSRQGAVPRKWPVQGVLTSGFGWRRSPFTRRWKFHSGLDLSAPRGTAVHAPAPGVVRTAKMTSGYGRLVELDHGFGIMTRFAHNSRLFVKGGDVVKVGQVISTVGMTGQTTGPHLHYEVHVDGQPVDPLEYLE
jgi:hypothetical protein